MPQLQCNPLSAYAENVCSQHGEDGILRHIFETLGIEKGFCVEFGACDGKTLSNTHTLIVDRGWSRVQIEPRDKWFVGLEKRFADRDDVAYLKSFVHFEGPDRLDTLLAKTKAPADFDFLSVDVDGNDYHIWEALRDYRPKVVIIEVNPSMHNNLCFVQPRDMSVCQGSSARAMVELGKEKGYELIATTLTNVIFVRDDLYPLFNIEDNTLENMRPPSRCETHLFQLYDGTLMLDGCRYLIWDNGDRIRNHPLQIYPKLLRRKADEFGFKRHLRAFWHKIYRLRPL